MNFEVFKLINAHQENVSSLAYTITNTRKDEDIWTHQGFFIDDFIKKIDLFLRKNDIPYYIVKE